MKEFLNFIGGEFVATGKTFDHRAPVDNRVIGKVHEAGRAEVDAAVRADPDASRTYCIVTPEGPRMLIAETYRRGMLT